MSNESTYEFRLSLACVLVCAVLGWSGSGFAESPDVAEAPVLDLKADETAEVGGLDGASVDRVLAEEVRAIRSCTRTSTPSGADWVGHLTVRFALPPEGKVEAIEVESNSAAEAAEGCVISAIRRVDLPRPDDQTIVVRRSFALNDSMEGPGGPLSESDHSDGEGEFSPSEVLEAAEGEGEGEAEVGNALEESEDKSMEVFEGSERVKKPERPGPGGDEGEHSPDTDSEEFSGELSVDSAAEVRGDGELSGAGIQSVLERYAARFLRCYEERLGEASSAEGRVVVSFQIGRAGRTNETEVLQNDPGGEVGACVAKVMDGLRFPRPNEGTVTVEQEFVFEPSSGEGVDASEESNE